jgi:hypothetical protein
MRSMVEGSAAHTDLALHPTPLHTPPMTDLHEPRGPRITRTEKILGVAAMALFAGGIVTDMLEGPQWIEHGLWIAGIALALLASWLGARARRRPKP